MDVQMSQNGDTTVGEVSYEWAGGGGAVQTMISEGGDLAHLRDDYMISEGGGGFRRQEDGSPNADEVVLESSDGHVVLARAWEAHRLDSDELVANARRHGIYEKSGATYACITKNGEPGNWYHLRAFGRRRGRSCSVCAAAEVRRVFAATNA